MQPAAVIASLLLVAAATSTTTLSAASSTTPTSTPTPTPTPTPLEEAALAEALAVVRHDFRFLRHEWAYTAIKYRGFLRHFSAPWRLVANLGGAYTVGGSVYFNKWAWEKALKALAELAGEMERYHRVYRAVRPGGHLRRYWLTRYPRLARDTIDFVDFVERHSARVSDCSGRRLEAFLAPGVSYGGGGGRADNATCGLLGLAGDILADATAGRISAALAGYVRLSELAWAADAWPGQPGEPPADSSAAAVPGEGSAATASIADEESALAANLSQPADSRSLSRQVLGHLLLHLRRRVAGPPAGLADFRCRVIREDLDGRLAKQLDAGEMAELNAVLDDCRNDTAPSSPDEEDAGIVTSAYSQLLALWEDTRQRLWREFSAYRQYRSRIPAILGAKSALRAVLPLIAAVGLLLNAAVLLFYARRARRHGGGRSLLIALLAVSDSALLIVSPVSLFTDNYMEHNHSLRPTGAADLWCKFQPHLFNLAAETSAYLLVVLAAERFLAVRACCSVTGCHKPLPPRRLWVLALSAFCAACILNCLLVIGDELAAPARSTVGRQCVQYVRLRHFDSNLAYVTRAKPALNAAARSLAPFGLVLGLSLATCRLLCRRGAYRLLLRQDEARADQPELPAAVGQLCLALAYLLLTAPAPVVHALFMTAHADRLVVKLSNGLVDESDPMFRSHWQRLGRLTVVQYAAEFGLLPASAACCFFAFVATDVGFRGFVRAALHGRAAQQAGSRSMTALSASAAMDASTAAIADSSDGAAAGQVAEMAGAEPPERRRKSQASEQPSADWEQTDLI